MTRVLWGEPDPKPPPRIIDPEAGRDKLRREGRCRICGLRPGQEVFIRLPDGRKLRTDRRVPALTRHHLIERSQGGDDVDANLVPLCGHGTLGCHGDVTAWRNDARERLRKRLRPEEIDYILGLSPGLLDRLYPESLH